MFKTARSAARLARDGRNAASVSAKQPARGAAAYSTRYWRRDHRSARGRSPRTAAMRADPADARCGIEGDVVYVRVSGLLASHPLAMKAWAACRTCSGLVAITCAGA